MIFVCYGYGGLVVLQVCPSIKRETDWSSLETENI